jgi:hypothetical protein
VWDRLDAAILKELLDFVFCLCKENSVDRISYGIKI